EQEPREFTARETVDLSPVPSRPFPNPKCSANVSTGGNHCVNAASRENPKKTDVAMTCTYAYPHSIHNIYHVQTSHRLATVRYHSSARGITDSATPQRRNAIERWMIFQTLSCVPAPRNPYSQLSHL
ncbi:hypothetical protein NEUTE2DRAFT_56826, partial [Neurospora tetrasperma FGSC 2509]